MSAPQEVVLSAGSMAVLLHHYFSPEAHPDHGEPSYANALGNLAAKDLIVMDSGAVWRPSQRGYTYIAMLLATPLPEKQWVDPR